MECFYKGFVRPDNGPIQIIVGHNAYGHDVVVIVDSDRLRCTHPGCIWKKEEFGCEHTVFARERYFREVITQFRLNDGREDCEPGPPYPTSLLPVHHGNRPPEVRDPAVLTPYVDTGRPRPSSSSEAQRSRLEQLVRAENPFEPDNPRFNPLDALAWPNITSRVARGGIKHESPPPEPEKPTIHLAFEDLPRRIRLK